MNPTNLRELVSWMCDAGSVITVIAVIAVMNSEHDYASQRAEYPECDEQVFSWGIVFYMSVNEC